MMLYLSFYGVTLINIIRLSLNEPRHEKICFLHICENKGADQLCSNVADQMAFQHLLAG